MSLQSAKNFIHEMQKNPQIKKQFANINSHEEVKKFLHKHGYTFTKEEFQRASKEALGKELSESELGEFSGGSTPLAYLE